MRACARARFGSPGLAGRRIVIAGLGHVGAKLARRLVEHGADVAVSDIDTAKREVALELGAEWLEPAQALVAQCDILAPCALGGAIDAASCPCCAARSSAAAPTTSSPTTRSRTSSDERGILYAPDFVVNAGGLIHVYREIRGYCEEHARELALGIEVNARRHLRGRGRGLGHPPRGGAATPRRLRRSLERTRRVSAVNRRSARLRPYGSEVWAVRLGLVPYEEAAPAQRALEAARHDGRDPRRAAAARASARLHQGPPLDPGRAADGRGLVPDAGDRGARHRPRRPRHLPRPGPAGRLPDRRPARPTATTSTSTCGGWSG